MRLSEKAQMETMQQILPWLTGAGFIGLLGAIGLLWQTIRKVRRDDRAASVQERTDDQSLEVKNVAGMVKYFERLFAERAKFHAADVGTLRAELAQVVAKYEELRLENVSCREESIRQDEHSKHQDQRIQEQDAHSKKQDEEIRSLRHKLANVESNFAMNKSVADRIERQQTTGEDTPMPPHR